MLKDSGGNIGVYNVYTCIAIRSQEKTEIHKLTRLHYRIRTGGFQ